MVSAVDEVEVAVQAMKDGAYHYITKEFDYSELLARLLHRESRRMPAPFIPVNLAAVQRELAESTLFGLRSRSTCGQVISGSWRT